MALPFTTVRHHSSSSVFLTDIIYSADFCYLVTAQEREARDNDTREGEHLFPSRVSLARNVLYWAHYDIDMILPSAYYAGYSISALAVQEAQKAKHRPYYQLYRQQHSEQAWLCAVSFYFEDFRETWTRKFHHRDFCFLKSPWCVRNPAYLPIKYRERPQIAIIWLFDRCISLNSTYSKMIYYEIGSKRSLRIRKAKWQRRTNYITQALSGHARVSRHVVKLYKRSPSVKTSNIARTCHQNLIKGFVQFSENMAPVAASFIFVIAGKIASFDPQSPTLLTLIFVDYRTLGVIPLSTCWKQHREKNDGLCFCRVDYKVFWAITALY